MTEFPEDPIAVLTKRVEDLEGVVKHMITALTGFSETYRQPDETKPSKEPLVARYFIGIPTANGLYLDSYYPQPIAGVMPKYDNALYVCLLGEDFNDISYVDRNAWAAFPSAVQGRRYKATPGQIQRAQQLVEEYENTKSSE